MAKIYTLQSIVDLGISLVQTLVQKYICDLRGYASLSVCQLNPTELVEIKTNFPLQMQSIDLVFAGN